MMPKKSGKSNDRNLGTSETSKKNGSLNDAGGAKVSGILTSVAEAPNSWNPLSTHPILALKH